MICTPKPVRLPCLQLTEATELKKLHSTLHKYKGTEFVCEQGAPALGGWIVQQNGRMEYMTDAKFRANFQLAEAPIKV